MAFPRYAAAIVVIMPNNSYDPWSHAAENGRNYITPEDIQDAIDAGADQMVLSVAVLKALGQKKCEDWSCCAFVAGNFKRTGPQRS
jgi:hypothetical protein